MTIMEDGGWRMEDLDNNVRRAVNEDFEATLSDHNALCLFESQVWKISEHPPVENDQ